MVLMLDEGQNNSVTFVLAEWGTYSSNSVTTHFDVHLY